MVLRALTPYNLVFFTDKRSDKCSEILNRPDVSVHSYSQKYRTQIQFCGTGLVTKEHPKFEQWRLKGLRRAEDYGASSKPGAPCTDYTNIQYDLDLAADNFTLLIVKVSEIELLRLGDPHERCQWTRTENENWQKTWLVP